MILGCIKFGPSDLLMFNLFKRSRTSCSNTDIGVDSLKTVFSGRGSKSSSVSLQKTVPKKLHNESAVVCAELQITVLPCSSVTFKSPIFSVCLLFELTYFQNFLGFDLYCFAIVFCSSWRSFLIIFLPYFVV